MSNHPITDFSDLIGTLFDPGAAREALNTLEYLIREFDQYGSIDAINMRHVREVAPKLRAMLKAYAEVENAMIGERV